MAVTIREQDSFASGGRGSPNAISPASNGHTWAVASGTSTLGFTGSAGTLTGTTSTNILLLGATSLPCIDLVCFFQPGQTQDLMGVVGRYNTNSGTNHYRATCQVSGGIATFKITKVVLGGPTDIVTRTVTTETAGFWVHFQISDLATNNLNANYWLFGGSEPAGWMLTATDHTQQLLVPGQVGIIVKANGTGATQSFNSFTAQDVFVYPTPPATLGDLPYGMTLGVVNGVTAVVPFLTQQTIVDLLNLGGTGMWLRYQAQWATIEPNADGVYIWPLLDYAVSLCNSFGIRILWPVQAPPAGYLTVRATDGTEPGGTGFSYANATRWATFCTAVAQRYNGSVNSPYTGFPMTIDALQLENENYAAGQTGVTYTYPGGAVLAQWLVAVAQACYPVIKANAPNCRVGVCAVRKSPTNANAMVALWMTNLFTYNGGIGSNVDWLDFHFYRDGSSAGLDPTVQNSDSPSVATELATIIATAKSNGQAPQVWCNEFGWNWLNASSDVNLTDSQVSTPALITQYNLSMFDALRVGGGTKVMMFTADPGATVTVKNLNPGSVPTNVSSIQKSLIQTIGGVYTYEPPTWAVLQAYIKNFPASTWGPTPHSVVTVFFATSGYYPGVPGLFSGGESVQIDLTTGQVLNRIAFPAQG